MKKYIFKRCFHFIFIFIIMSFFAFTLMNIGNSDVIDVMESQNGTAMSQVEKEQLRHELGLDQPQHVQYLSWLKGVVTGDLGMSFVSQRPVGTTFVQKLPATVLLTTVTFIASLLISLPLGILSALYHHRWLDRIIRMMTFFLQSFPGFFLAFLFIYIFALQLDLLPVMSPSMSLQGLILPVMTLSMPIVAKYVKQIRQLVIEEMHHDYIEGAISRGLSYREILWHSVMPKVMLTMMSFFGLSLGSLLGGTAIIESVFMWDGVGKMAVDAIMMKDYPIILTYVIYMALIYVVINLIIDILYHYLNPQVRLENRHEAI